jgi:hypothetical protein
MIGRTAERLRELAVGIGDTVGPHDIPALRLDGVRQQLAGERWNTRWRSGRMLLPVAAAASVFALVTGVSLASQVFGLAQGEPSRPVAAPVALPFGTPKFMVISAAATGYVRAVATGRLIAKIPAPAKGYAIEGIAAAPGDRVFYLAGETFVGGQSSHGLLTFYRVVLGSDGKPGRARRVPGPAIAVPLPISSDGLITIPVAVSPDGNYLAYAISRQLLGDAGRRPATITVVRLATGASRTWTLRPAGPTQISELSWAEGGQLSWVGVIGDATVANGSVVRHRGDELSVVMVLGTAVPGRSLVVDSRLVSYGWRPESATGESAVLDGPTAGVITADGRTVAAQILTEHGQRSKLVAMSAVTGQITRVLLDGPRSFQADPASIDGDSLLFTLSPRHEHPTGNYVCGHLALDQLSTAKIVRLPVEMYCSTVWPGPPFYAAW